MNNSLLVTTLVVCLGLTNVVFAQHDVYSTAQSYTSFERPSTVQLVPYSNQYSTGMETVGRTNGFFEQSNSTKVPRHQKPFQYRSNSGRYLTLFGGWNLLNDHDGATDQSRFRDGFIAGFGKGRYLNNYKRIELENSWAKNSGSQTPGGVGFDGNINNFSTMVNLYKDLTPESLFGFYVGGGLGFSRQDGDFTSGGVELEMEDYAFAYQGIVGANYRVTGHGSDLYVEYRYKANTETDIESRAGQFIDTFDYESHNIIFGIRIKK